MGQCITWREEFLGEELLLPIEELEEDTDASTAAAAGLLLRRPLLRDRQARRRRTILHLFQNLYFAIRRKSSNRPPANMIYGKENVSPGK